LVFDEVQADLEAEGYEVQPFILPAASVNAPHKRDRVWFVAYSKNNDARRIKSKHCEREGNKEIRTGLWNESTSDGFLWPATDTDHNGYATTKNGQGLGEGNDRNKTGQNDAIEFEGRAVSDGVAENTLCSGRLYGEPEQEGAEIREQRNACPGDSIGVCGAKVAGVAPDTNPKRLQWKRESAELERRRFGFNNAQSNIPNWDKFPTQSPLCSRTNGISTELHGITFSKWRNESIKAAGNAIVPQVVFQIFKAINEYREKYP
jgi:DNA (cytosine-5)-methyltransferase 1